MTPHTAHSRQTRTQEEPMDTLLEQATPRTEAGRQLLDLLESDSARPFLRSVMATNIADVEAEAVNAYEPLVKALQHIADLGTDAPAFGGDPGDFYRDQLWAAIGTAARALATVESSPERDGGEHRPAIGLSSAGAHKLCMKCGEPWPCRSVSDR